MGAQFPFTPASYIITMLATNARRLFTKNTGAATPSTTFKMMAFFTPKLPPGTRFRAAIRAMPRFYQRIFFRFRRRRFLLPTFAGIFHT